MDKAEGKDAGGGAGGGKAKKIKPNEKCPCGSKAKYNVLLRGELRANGGPRVRSTPCSNRHLQK